MSEEYDWDKDVWKYVHSVLVFFILWGCTVKYKWLAFKDIRDILLISVFFVVPSCIAIIPYFFAQMSAYSYDEGEPSHKKWIWLKRILYTILYDLIVLGVIVNIFFPHGSSYYGDHDMGDYWDSRIP